MGRALFQPDASCFGGSLHKSHPKSARPYVHYRALHMVMRSTLARGRHSMLEPARRRKIQEIVRRQSARFGVRMCHFANSGNHLHLLMIPPRDRARFAGFVRAVSGLVARATLGAERGNAKGKKFWDLRPFSREIPMGRPFQSCLRYVSRNVLDALGFGEPEAVLAEIRSWNTGPPRQRVTPPTGSDRRRG